MAVKPFPAVPEYSALKPNGSAALRIRWRAPSNRTACRLEHVARILMHLCILGAEASGHAARGRVESRPNICGYQGSENMTSLITK